MGCSWEPRPVTAGLAPGTGASASRPRRENCIVTMVVKTGGISMVMGGTSNSWMVNISWKKIPKPLKWMTGGTQNWNLLKWVRTPKNWVQHTGSSGESSGHCGWITMVFTVEPVVIGGCHGDWMIEKSGAPTYHPNRSHLQVVIWPPENLGGFTLVNWLVVGPPLWKIWVHQLGWRHSQYMGK